MNTLGLRKKKLILSPSELFSWGLVCLVINCIEEDGGRVGKMEQSSWHHLLLPLALHMETLFKTDELLLTEVQIGSVERSDNYD